MIKDIARKFLAYFITASKIVVFSTWIYLLYQSADLPFHASLGFLPLNFMLYGF